MHALAVFLTVLFGAGRALAQEVSPLAEELLRYHRGQDVFFMLMLVAFLMLFIKRYQWGIALMTILVLSASFPLYFAVRTMYFGHSGDIVTIILGVVASITLVIACGMFLGQIKTWHFLVMSVLFVPAYAFNEWFLFTYLKGVADAGGSLLVHAFAAYFGFGVILALRHKEVQDIPMKATVHSVSFVWLASMLLWMLWPSFTSALVAPEKVVSVMLVTYMALMGSTLSTYVLLSALQKKIDPLIFTYAILSGGVTIGSTIDLVGPWVAFLIGILAGVASTLCFLYLHQALLKATGVLDVMGVHNLHGIPGVLGALLAIPFAGTVQITAAIGTIVIGLLTGLLSGVIVKAFGKPVCSLDDEECFPMSGFRASA
ncbi:MAG: ammonium transporter [Firmicutes bacterium]|nr:ammonium transporter [Bacillota bacterium]